MIYQTHLKGFCICTKNGSVRSVGEQTHHQAVHVLVLRSPGQVLNACRHVLDKKKNQPNKTHVYD